MKKIHVITLITTLLAVFAIPSFSNTTTDTDSENALSSAVSNLTHFLYSSVIPAPKSQSVAVSLSPPPVNSTFPLPEGMKTAPPLLSSSITSAISSIIASTMTPEWMAIITSKTETKTSVPPVPVQMASFQPVGPPSGLTSIDNSTSNPLSLTTASKSDVKQKSKILMMQSLKPKSFTGTFDITSRYVFRGISHNANNPAFQGGLTYTFLRTGIYFNVWGSNVDFLSRQGQQASVEADTIAGIKNNIGKNFTYDFSIVRYNYPKASGANYNEFVSRLIYRIFTVTLGYSSNAFNAHANGLYYNGAFSLPIPERYAFQYTNVSLIGNYGHYNLSKDAGLRSYSDFMLGIKKAINQYTLILQWAGTNGEAKLKGLDANRLVGTVAVNL